MGLKFFREETKHDVYYPVPGLAEGVRFTVKVASAKGRRRVLDAAKTNPITGETDIPIGTWTEEKLKACVAGWDEAKLGRPFSIDNLLDLDVEYERFLIGKIDELDLIGIAARAPAEGNPTPSSPTSA